MAPSLDPVHRGRGCSRDGHGSIPGRPAALHGAIAGSHPQGGGSEAAAATGIPSATGRLDRSACAKETQPRGRHCRQPLPRHRGEPPPSVAGSRGRHPLRGAVVAAGCWEPPPSASAAWIQPPTQAQAVETTPGWSKVTTWLTCQGGSITFCATRLAAWRWKASTLTSVEAGGVVIRLFRLWPPSRRGRMR